MGHGKAVAAERHAERRIAASVDDPDSHPFSGRAGEGLRVGGRAAVDQVVRVEDVAGIPAQQLRTGAHQHVAAGAAAHHPAHPTAELLKHVVRRAGYTIQPVVENDHPFVVVGQRFVRVLDDERAVQATVQLRADVRMKPVGARLCGDELVVEVITGLDRRLGCAWNPVHVVSQRQAVPVHGCACRELIAHSCAQGVARRQSDRRRGNRPEAPRVRCGAGEVDLRR